MKIFYGSILWLLIFTSSLFAQNYQVYFGDLHQHSTLSFDANSTALNPAAAFQYAKNTANLDFFALTDHGNDLNNGKPLEGWQSLLNAALANTSDEFVALGSQEVGLVFGNGGYGHLGIHNSPDLADNNVFPNVRFDLDDMYDFIIARNGLAHFCHPGINGDASSRFNNFTYNAQADPFFYGIEVLSGFRSDSYENFYFMALENGWHVGPVTGQDNHGRNYGNRVDSDGTINLTGVLLDTLNREKLLDAFRNQRTYAFRTSPASDRMFLTEFTADGNWMGEEFDNDDNILSFIISVHAENKFISAQLYRNGQLLKIFHPDSNDFTWTVADSASFGSTYYFVKLIQEDTDELWSSPIWVNSPGTYQPPESIVVAIGELRPNLASGLPANLGRTNITIQGIVTVANQFGDFGPGYLQDSTGGIAIFGDSFIKKVIPGLPLQMEVRGVVSFFNGLTEINPYSVKRIGVKSFPEPLVLSTGEIASNGENYEGSLVKIVGATISGTFPSPGSNLNMTINDGSGSVAMRIDKDTNIPGNTTPTGPVTITGVVGQFDTSAPYASGYQVLPRSIDDFDISTDVSESNLTIPDQFILAQNYPNPFNGETVILFSVPVQSHIVLTIYDLGGRLVREWVTDNFSPGNHQIRWNGRNDAGKLVGSGVYFYRLVSADFTLTKKMVLVD